MSADIVKHLDDHEKHAKLSAGERSALRHKHKFMGLHYTDEKLLMTEAEFKGLLADTHAHSVGAKPHQVTSFTAPKHAADPHHARVVKE
jgi:hypothetical protein